MDIYTYRVGGVDAIIKSYVAYYYTIMCSSLYFMPLIKMKLLFIQFSVRFKRGWVGVRDGGQRTQEPVCVTMSFGFQFNVYITINRNLEANWNIQMQCIPYSNTVVTTW